MIGSKGKPTCFRYGASANYCEACKERFYSLRSASVDVVCSHPYAHVCQFSYHFKNY